MDTSFESVHQQLKQNLTFNGREILGRVLLLRTVAYSQRFQDWRLCLN